MNAERQRRLTPVLVALAVLLAAGLLLLLSGVGRGTHWAPPRTLAPLPASAGAASLPRPAPLQQFALVWRKPLFNPDRKPVAHAVDGGSSLGDLQLTGIILTPGLHMALLHDNNGDRQVRVREGEALPDGGATLVELRPRSALFDSTAGRTELKLPAGAPIDPPRAASTAADDAAPGDALLRVTPAEPAPATDAPRDGGGSATIAPQQPSRRRRDPQQAPEDRSRSSLIERIRENNQRRRAARAAAHQGVR